MKIRLLTNQMNMLLEQGAISFETLKQLEGILEDLLEKTQVSKMIGKYIEEELNNNGYDAKIQKSQTNNVRDGTRTILVNTIDTTESTSIQKIFFFFKRKITHKTTHKNHICVITVHYDKVEIKGPTYPEHYTKFNSADPKFMDNILGYIAGCIVHHGKFPCIRAYHGLLPSGYDAELAKAHTKALNVPINPA